jgi:hypothetical protein
MDELLPSQTAIERVIEMVTGCMLSRAIHVAAELGVADLLADGSKTISELASATSAQPEALYRLLRMLASYNIFAE